MMDLNLAPIANAIRLIVTIAPVIKNQVVDRNDRLIRILNELGLKQDHPPREFTPVYMYALAEYGVDKDERQLKILDLFRQKEIIDAFRQSFEQKAPCIFEEGVDQFFYEKSSDYILGELDSQSALNMANSLNIDFSGLLLVDNIRQQNFDIQHELNQFRDKFIDVAKKTRTPSEIIQDQKIDDLTNFLKKIAEVLLKFPVFTRDQLWELLVDKATKNDDRMKPEIANNLGMWNPAPRVSKGTPFHFVVNFETSGYLILLEKNPEKQIWCLSPSCLAPPSFLEVGTVKLPLAYQNTFTADTVGREEMVAIISQNKPSLDWLPKDNDEPLEMRKDHLAELLDYLKQKPEIEILRSGYQVTE